MAFLPSCLANSPSLTIHRFLYDASRRTFTHEQRRHSMVQQLKTNRANRPTSISIETDMQAYLPCGYRASRQRAGDSNRGHHRRRRSSKAFKLVYDKEYNCNGLLRVRPTDCETNCSLICSHLATSIPHSGAKNGQTGATTG